VHASDALAGAYSPSRQGRHGGAPNTPYVPVWQKSVQFATLEDPGGDRGEATGQSVQELCPSLWLNVPGGHVTQAVCCARALNSDTPHGRHAVAAFVLE